MQTDICSVEYRLGLARAMREAGASFDVIAEVLRARQAEELLAASDQIYPHNGWSGTNGDSAIV